MEPIDEEVVFYYWQRQDHRKLNFHYLMAMNVDLYLSQLDSIVFLGRVAPLSSNFTFFRTTRISVLCLSYRTKCRESGQYSSVQMIMLFQLSAYECRAYT